MELAHGLTPLLGAWATAVFAIGLFALGLGAWQILLAFLLGAVLSGARFLGANLWGVELSEASDWESAICDRYTVLPAGFRCNKGKLAHSVPALAEEAEATQAAVPMVP